MSCSASWHRKRRPTSAARFGRRGTRSLTRCLAIRRRQLRRQAGAGLGPGGGEARSIAPPPAANENQTGGLTEPFRGQTGARDEALHLAFRNAFVVLDGSAEAAHRTFGCLYGVELYGGSNPLAIVPSAVSTVSAIQKLFSALMIFLFGLALRNMLKMK